MDLNERIEDYKNGKISKEELVGHIIADSDSDILKKKFDLVEAILRRLKNAPNLEIPKAVFHPEWEGYDFSFVIRGKRFSFEAIIKRGAGFVTFYGQEFESIPTARAGVEAKLAFLLSM